MAVELATAYVTLKVDGREVPAGVRRSFAGADAVAGQMGARSGKSFGQGFTRNTISTDKAMERIGKASKRAFLVGAAGIAVANKVAADFNAEMATVTTLAKANIRQQQQLAQAAKTVGVNIGYSATQSASGEEELVKAGVSVKNILGGGLKGALDLAAAGQTDVATATEVAASAMTQFKLKGQDVPHIADLLAAGADKALGSVTDLGYGLAQVGTVAHQMGFSIEATTGTLAQFAQNGLLGEKGGAALKQMFLRLANPTKKSQGLMDQYGLSLYKANGQIKTMPELAGNLQKSFEHLTPAQRNAALGTIFGSRAIQAANILLKGGEKTNRRWISSVNDQGFAAHQAAGKMNSLKGDVQKLKAQFDNAFINASGKQNFLRELAQDGIKLIGVYNRLSDSQRSFLNHAVVRGTELAGAVYAATKIYKLAKSTSELMGWATGRGAVGKAMGKAIGGGVRSATGTRVWVENWPPGIAGVAGKAGAVEGAAVGAAASRASRARMAVGTLAVTATSVLLAGQVAQGISQTLANFLPRGPKDNGLFSDFTKPTSTGLTSGFKNRDTLKSSFSAVSAMQGGGGINGYGIKSSVNLGKLATLGLWNSAQDDIDRVKKLDTNLANLDKRKPGEAMKAYQKILDQTGLSAKQLNKILPKTAVAMDPEITGNWTKGITGALTGVVSKVANYSKVLKTVPAQIRSYVSTPGAALSIASMQRLTKQYHLTPKQVRTIMELQGFTQTQIRIEQAGKKFRSLPKQVRTDLRANTVKSMADVAALQRRYHLTPSQVRTVMKVSGVDQALGQIRTVTHALAGVHDKTVTLRIQRSGTFSVAGVHGNAGMASGGTVLGQRRPYGDKVPALLAPGEEVIPNQYGQADRNRALLKAISANRMAAGGTVGNARAVSGQGDGVGSGDVTLHLYDTDGVLIGTVYGAADERYYANQALQAQDAP